VYVEHDFAPAEPDTRYGRLRVPWGTLFAKGVTVGFGRTHDRRYTVPLRDLVLSGRARPGAIVTHRLPLDAAPEVYARFDRREGGIIKAVLQPT
jgi:glutathione-independent formaldehyde dehydrogenase